MKKFEAREGILSSGLMMSEKFFEGRVKVTVSFLIATSESDVFHNGVKLRMRHYLFSYWIVTLKKRLSV